MNNKILSLVKTSHPDCGSLKPVDSTAYGMVHLVGAGPGDAELITVKAMRLLQQADAIVYDRLANPELLDYAPQRCDLIYVGKKKDQHSLPQEQICELLAALARCGKNVVRLKGGDCFIFGRGGEEVDHLNKQGIQCSIVPGITAAIGCAAATQIPLTHRDHAHAVTFITGHRQQGKMHINWDLALQKDSTVVFYMGLSNLQEITRQLIERGCPVDKPFAVVAQGTSNNQQVMLGTVSDIAERLKDTPLPSPALLMMGDVINANGYVQQLAEQTFTQYPAEIRA
ncbi:MAG: uroporphyrinogen-III C-methyltransferase [Porticoccaceae bacterium]|nr:uroporphyrinogen-III C-methyltransferase [Porticoccaceae bacterium]MAE04416.1 uroporphyrinogen-III C-methyltransferase [Porticoccaceae bacterium]MDG2115854.1 uroporphyrinogen-III C-methyltransferase [Porticoccaceae bacterium]|tara:strand:- start:1445 stop:2296 length:852 start_codon:yes stop_codon:yes gene_type:complete